MTPTVSRSPAGTRPDRVRVDDISVVVVARPGGPPLADLLEALAAQGVRPHRLLLTGLDPEGEEITAAREHPLVARDRVPLLARSPLSTTPGDAGRVRPGELGEPATWRVLEDARGALPVHADHWLWVLSDDSLPEPGALEALVGAVRRSSRVGVVGPKLVRLDDPRLLVGVGHHLTVGGRAADTRQAALVDQGQLDLRQDVLGVPLVGSLVRSDVLADAGGIDAAFGSDGVAGLDLGWRSHLVGQRVVVAPDAVVRQGEAGLGVVDARRTRVRQRQLALARGSVWATPWRALGIVVTSTLAALFLLLVKRPHEAADEWADVRAVLSPRRGLGARLRFRSRREVRPRDLSGLFVPAISGWRSTLDTVGEALDPRDRAARERTPQGGTRGSTETGPVSDEFAELGGEGARRRRWSWPLAVALLLASAVAGWRWRDLLPALSPGGPGVAGGELGPAATGSGGLWRSALDGWRGDGLGHAGAAEPWLLPLSGLARLVEAVPGAEFTPATAGVALGWLLLAAVPAAVLTAYVALRRVSRRRWLRAGLALGWAGLAPLTVAVGEGRVGPALVHVLAPLLLAGYAVSATRTGGVRRTAAAFATVLGVTVAAQWVPLVLVPATLGGLALLVLGRGSARWRGAALAVLPWLLLLPWLPAVVADPVRVLGGAGATVAGSAFPGGPPPWQLLLLHPGAAVPFGSFSLPGLALLLTVPLWLAAAGALVLGGRAGRRAAVLVAAAVLLVGLAMLAPRLALGVLPDGHQESGQVVTAWSGTLVSLAGAALLLAAGLGLDRLLRLLARRRAGRDGDAAAAAEAAAGAEAEPVAGKAGTDVTGPAASRWGRPVAVVAVAGVLLAVLAGVTALGLTVGADDAAQLRAATDPLPPVASEQARGPAALRTLVLQPLDAGEDGTAADDEAPVRSVRVDLRGDEPEPARVLRDRAVELAAGLPAEPQLEAAATAVTGRGTPAEAVSALEDLAVGYVLVVADAGHPLVTQVDSLPGLSRVSSPQGEVLWRMTDNDAARVRVLDADGVTLQRVDVTGPHAAASGVARDLPDGATLQVAEGQGWGERATVHVDGAPVAVGPDGSVGLPSGTHEVDVHVRTPLLAWHLLALVLGAVVAFLALPFGRVEADPEETSR